MEEGQLVLQCLLKSAKPRSTLLLFTRPDEGHSRSLCIVIPSSKPALENDAVLCFRIWTLRIVLLYPMNMSREVFDRFENGFEEVNKEEDV